VRAFSNPSNSASGHSNCIIEETGMPPNAIKMVINVPVKALLRE